jgi:hypothetical protein
LTKLQVLQFMLTVPPWRSFNLSVTCFSNDAKGWWDQARKLGPVVRTEAAVRKWEKERLKEGTENQDPWGTERGEWLNRVNVDLRIEGVDGKRLVRAGERAEGDEGGRMRVDDGKFRIFAFGSQRRLTRFISQTSSSNHIGTNGVRVAQTSRIRVVEFARKVSMSR